jgi:hypothetical protein
MQDIEHVEMIFKHTKHLASFLPPLPLASFVLWYPWWGESSDSVYHRVFACRRSFEAAVVAIEIVNSEVS